MSGWRFTIWSASRAVLTVGTRDEFLDTLRPLIKGDEGRLWITWSRDQAGAEDPAKPKKGVGPSDA